MQHHDCGPLEFVWHEVDDYGFHGGKKFENVRINFLSLSILVSSVHQLFPACVHHETSFENAVRVCGFSTWTSSAQPYDFKYRIAASRQIHVALRLIHKVLKVFYYLLISQIVGTFLGVEPGSDCTMFALHKVCLHAQLHSAAHRLPLSRWHEESIEPIMSHYAILWK